MAEILQRRKTAFEFRIFDSNRVQIKVGKQPKTRHRYGITNGGWAELLNEFMSITDKLKTNDLVEKGWTRELIKKFLPEPCLVVKNIRSKGVTNLYSVEKVEAAEKSPDFKPAQIKSLKQSAVSKLNRDKKRAETLLQTQTIPISVEIVEISKLRNLEQIRC